MTDRADHPSPHTLRERIASLSPNQLLGYGCAGIILIGTLTMYCGGIVSLVARPLLIERVAATPAPPQQNVLPSLAAPSPLPAFNLPPSQPTLPATPTQAPIPTRDRSTPTFEISGTPGVITGTVTGTLRATSSPIPSATATRR